MLRFIILDAFIKNTRQTPHPPCIRRRQTARQLVICAGFATIAPTTSTPRKKSPGKLPGEKANGTACGRPFPEKKTGRSTSASKFADAVDARHEQQQGDEEPQRPVLDTQPAELPPAGIIGGLTAQFPQPGGEKHRRRHDQHQHKPVPDQRKDSHSTQRKSMNS